MFVTKEIQPLEKNIFLATATTHELELSYIREAFETGWVTTVGANIDEIERQLAEKTGVKYAVGLSTGTSALHMCMKLAGVKRGDRVFCSDLTFDATVNPVVYEGGEQIFIDSERDTWNMDPDALEKAFELYPDVKVVVLVNLYGTPARLDEIRAICDRHGAILIEDAAESLGATYKGVQTGTFGSYNALSFNGNKIITGSTGGMLLTDDEQAAAKVRKWSTQAREKAPWYQHEELGYNYRISNITAGVVRGQLPYLEDHIARKKALYMRYKEGLKGLPVTMNPYLPWSEPNFWLSCMLIDEDAMCRQSRTATTASYEPEHYKSCPTEILEQMARHRAEGRPIWKPMSMQPIYRANLLVTAAGDAKHGSLTEITEDRTDVVGVDLFRRGLCLPSDIKMTEQEQNRIIQVIRACFD